jgi:hypothetical protein
MYLKNENGKLTLCEDNGSWIRTIEGNRGEKARFQGSSIAITYNDGRTKLLTETGSFIRHL